MDNARNILTISDVHLGNRSTPAEFILDNLTKFFKDFDLSNNFPNLKMVIFAGDLWDDTLSFSSPCISSFFRFWFRFCRWADKRGVVVRVLEGTPRHDRLHGANIATYTEQICPSLDFRYVKDLSVEVHKKLGLSFLYVPDECRPTADRIYQDVLDVLHEAGLDSVDIGIMHGMFKYQLGTIPMNAKVHREEDYLRLVNKFITIGHIHTQSFYEKIFAQGSFDRLAHNEEKPKGAYYFVETEPGEWDPIFLENTSAKVYKSIEVSKKLDSSLSQIESTVKKLPDYSHLRIIAKAGHEIFQAFDVLKKTYPFITFSKKVIEEVKKEEMVVVTETFKASHLNRQTLTEEIINEVNERFDITPEQLKRLYTQLENLHD